jgi:Derlin-2/3
MQHSPKAYADLGAHTALVYLWSRLNPSVRLSLFGVVTITAPYLPYALVMLSWALASSWNAVIGDLLGIIVGHVWYFFNRIWKEELGSGKKNWLDTPRVL